MLSRGIFASSGPLASLGVLLGEAGGPLERLGHTSKEPRDLLRARPGVPDHDIGGAHWAAGGIQLHQLGPPAL